MEFKIAPLSEESYSLLMTSEVEPYLAKIRREDVFISFDGKRIHYEAYPLKDAKANIVISHGFTESAEKFREVAYYFLKEGYSVFALDHRGHGQSYRIPGDGNIVKIDSFDDYIEDLRTFNEDIVSKSGTDIPTYIYAHSMGCAVAVLFLQKYPQVFKKAVLSSPMICPNTGMPIPLAKGASSLFCTIGKGNEAVFGRGKFDPEAPFETCNDTSEPRYKYYLSKKIKNPHLRTCGPSFNWVKEAIKITKIMLNEENCNKIKAEVLIFQPEFDKMVLPEYQDKFAQRVTGARIIKVPSAKHEIYMSTNDVLEKYYSDIFEFFA